MQPFRFLDNVFDQRATHHLTRGAPPPFSAKFSYNKLCIAPERKLGFSYLSRLSKTTTVPVSRLAKLYNVLEATIRHRRKGWPARCDIKALVAEREEGLEADRVLVKGEPED
jgi:hypothetical protein